ncbi:MAG TPA: nucleotidyltransferase family protein [Croceibacterium sp.]|nr:nucleotidyltransferase family protein [Croceibacterium sp.]
MARPAVAVLAAGRGTRFGGDKLEAPCAGKPLGRWAIEAVEAAELGPGTIITGPEWVSFAGGWTRAVNPHPEAGLASSLALAARLVPAGKDALLVLLADMPLVTADYLRELGARTAPAATRYPARHAGVPALLDKRMIEKASRLTGDRGAGPLLSRARLLDPPPGMLRDVDTPEDLAEAARMLRLAHP